MHNVIREDKRRKLDRPITGVIWKDRIWEQWYDKKALELPRTPVGKVDYKKLHQIGSEICKTHDSTDKLSVINLGFCQNTLKL